MAPWHLYALGGGWGHFTRAVSLARAAARHGIEVEILTNSAWGEMVVGAPSATNRSPPLRRLLDLSESIRFRILPPSASFEETAAEATEWVRSIQGGFLIVDTFPRGLGGELAEVIPQCGARRVWIHRDLEPRYIEEFNLEAFAGHFDLVLLPGEDAPLAHLPRAKKTAPWLVANFDELLPREAARRELGVSGSEPIVVVSGNGTEQEASASGELAARLEVALVGEARVIWVSSPFSYSAVPSAPQPCRLWPLLLLMRGIDVLVGGGGYHTVHEARATGTPLVAIAHPRRYDRQAKRLLVEERVDSFDETVAAIRSKLREAKRESNQVEYINGAATAVDLILEMGGGRSHG